MRHQAEVDKHDVRVPPVVNRRLAIVGALSVVFGFTFGATNSRAATCTGANPCNACKNCKHCKRCAKNGGTCGVCRTRGK